MPGPFTNPTQQGKTTELDGHLLYDGVGLNPLAAGFNQGSASDGAGFVDNRQGRRSGVTSSTPWVSGSWGPAGAGRPTISPYGDSNPSGAGTTYAATTLTDAGKLWGASDANSGGTVTYAAGSVTDTARNNANAWVVGNTAQYAGLVIITATGKIGIIASVAAGVATLVANWIGGTPAAGEAYQINRTNGFVGRQITSVAAGAITRAIILYHINTVATFSAWTNGTPANGAPYVIEPVDILGSHAQPPPAGPWVNGAFVPRGGGEKSDNAYKALSEESNTEVE